VEASTGVLSLVHICIALGDPLIKRVKVMVFSATLNNISAIS